LRSKPRRELNKIHQSTTGGKKIENNIEAAEREAKMKNIDPLI
jgi:hypothetical protein